LGIYDRDYYRQERPGFSLGLPHSAVVALILLNVAVYLLDALLAGDSNHWLDDALAVHVSTGANLHWWQAATLTHPWLWWQFVTYGFVHSSHHFTHILFNMLVLWFFGRGVEELYGRAEFVRLYLLLLAVGGVAWAAVNSFPLPGIAPLGNLSSELPVLIGASGAVTGIIILYALNFPRRTILFMFVLPMPAWGLALLVVIVDILGLTGYSGETHVAFVVHLAGAAFAALYYQQRWNFAALFRGRLVWPTFRSRGRLRVHRPRQDDEPSERELREKEVDRILEKIHREGESSLTRKERRVLETASREYQQRRGGN